MLFRSARWNGSTWSAMPGSNVGFVYAVTTLADGTIVAGGGSNGVQRWNSGSWTRLGGAFDGPIYSLTTLSDGTLVAGGRFNTVDSATARGIARWNGATWSPIGTGISSTDPPSFARYVNTTLESPGQVLNVGGY